MANNSSDIARKNTISRWRKKKQLCLRCGLDVHEGDDCIENYEVVDLRIKEVEVKQINEDKRKDTVIQYRKKKQLCLRCGLDVHEGVDCVENYESSDLRPEEEKKEDPRIVETPKLKIFEHNVEDTSIKLEATDQATFNRPFIIVDVREKYIGFIELRYLSVRFSNCIICVLGDINSIYPYSDVLKTSKLINVIRMKNDHNQQNVINHISGCKYFIGHDSDYSRYAITKNIKTVILKSDTDIKNIMSRIPKVNDD